MNEPIEVEWDADQFAKLLDAAVERGRQQGWREAIEALGGVGAAATSGISFSDAVDYLTSVAPTEGSRRDPRCACCWTDRSRGVPVPVRSREEVKVSDNLHERLVAEVQRRLEIARRAFNMTNVGDSRHWRSELMILNEAVTFVEANDPADAVRRYEADLRRLERHQPRLVALSVLVCGRCHPAEPGTGNGLWPCDEMRDLAASLGVEVPT